MMRYMLLGVLFAVFAAGSSAEFIQYDAAAVERFKNELRDLGVTLTSVSKPSQSTTPSDPTVTAMAGDFEGYWTESQFGRPIAAFEGIPYARPPVGASRFKVAQPASRLANFKAKKPGSKCPQRDLFLRMPDVKGSEDCLFLNVYVPEKTYRDASERLPVMFYVHGGGFVLGQGDAHKSNILLDKDVILVTLNYRLGTLGFLATGDDVIPANLGLKDQVAGLRWVHDNIAAFGGDPNLVTVFGHSAGGASVEYLMLSPLTKGLIHRVVSISGSTFAPWASTNGKDMAEYRKMVAQHLGCPPEPSKDLLACLQTKPAEEILQGDSIFKGQIWGPTPGIVFAPMVEGDIPGALIPRHPKELYSSLTNDVPYMTGVTAQEGTFFTADMNDTVFRQLDENFPENAATMCYLPKPVPEKHIESLRRAYFSPGPLSKANFMEASNMITDTYFLWPALKSVRYHRQGAKAPSYFYYFTAKGSQSYVQILGVDGNKENYGVTHGDDLFYLFAFPGVSKPSPKDVLMSTILTDVYSSFARDGVPSSRLLNTIWQPVTTQGTDVEFLQFETPLDMSMQKDLLPERWRLLEELFGSPEK